MTNRYDVIKETVSAENKLHLVTFGDYEKVIKNLLENELDPDPETVKSFDNEEDAFKYESKMKPEIEFGNSYPFGKRIAVTTYSVIRVEIDEDGDEVESEYIGSSNAVTVEDVMNVTCPKDDEEEEDME